MITDYACAMVHLVTFDKYVEIFIFHDKNVNRYRLCTSAFFKTEPGCNIVYLRIDKYREWNECLSYESF